MALSENYRTETIGRSDCRPIVRLSADTIVRWDYRPNPNGDRRHENRDAEGVGSGRGVVSVSPSRRGLCPYSEIFGKFPLKMVHYGTF